MAYVEHGNRNCPYGLSGCDQVNASREYLDHYSRYYEERLSVFSALLQTSITFHEPESQHSYPTGVALAGLVLFITLLRSWKCPDTSNDEAYSRAELSCWPSLAVRTWQIVRWLLFASVICCTGLCGWENLGFTGFVSITVVQYYVDWHRMWSDIFIAFERAKVTLSALLMNEQCMSAQCALSLSSRLLILAVLSFRSFVWKVEGLWDEAGEAHRASIGVVLCALAFFYRESRSPTAKDRVLQPNRYRKRVKDQSLSKNWRAQHEDAVLENRSKELSAEASSVQDTTYTRPIRLPSFTGSLKHLEPRGQASNTIMHPLDIRYIITGIRQGDEHSIPSSIRTDIQTEKTSCHGVCSTYIDSIQHNVSGWSIPEYHGMEDDTVWSSTTLADTPTDDERTSALGENDDSGGIDRRHRIGAATGTLLKNDMPKLGTDLEGWLEAMDQYLCQASMGEAK